MQVDLAIKSKNIVTPSEIIDGMLLISDGKIADIISIFSYGALPETALLDFPIEDVGDCVVMPGLIDPHVHIAEAGLTVQEGFDLATKAAASGGITTLVDGAIHPAMAATGKKSLMHKIDAVNKNVHVDCSFWGGVDAGNEDNLEELLEAGVVGLKTFLPHYGTAALPESGREQIVKALKILKKYDRPLLVGFETGASPALPPTRSYSSWLESMPKKLEEEAVSMMIDLCRETEARIHIAHLSSAGSIEPIQKAKSEGLPLTADASPHHLFFHAEAIPDGDLRFHLSPPVREKENNEELWSAIRAGIIDFIASGFFPAQEVTGAETQNAANRGIACLQFSLPVTWTGALERNFSVTDISRWMCSNPSKFLKLDSGKGKIIRGFDADLCLWNPAARFTVKEDLIHHSINQTPYLAEELYGAVHQTFLHGTKIYSEGRLLKPNQGRIIPGS